MTNNKIKAILFDMDGVLIEAKDWHYEALNKALTDHNIEIISREDHLTRFDGLSTNQKLDILSKERGLDKKLYQKINDLKQKYTWEIGLKNIKPIALHIKAMEKLKNDGYKLAVCSNSIRKTVDLFLSKADLLKYMDFFLSNEDVKNKKPHPDIYIEAIKKMNLNPDECLIIEDNFNGLKAARASKANVLKVDSILDVDYGNIKNRINQIDKNTSINIVVPMAGAGSRFVEAGYKDPKPFIDVNGKCMIERVLDNLRYPNAKYILIVRKEHFEQRVEFVAQIKKHYNVEFISVDKLTEGAVCTVLKARNLINNDIPLMIANSDQIIDIKIENFVNDCLDRSLDGSILTFIDKERNPKWSFAKINENNLVTQVKEKQLISNRATVGIYLFKEGRYFVDGSIDMIVENDRVNNEFYVCPVYNYIIADNKKIGFYDIKFDQMHGTGTPADLEIYLELLNKNNK